MMMNRTYASLALALAATFGMATASTDAALMVDLNDRHVAGGDWETIPEPTGSYTLSDGTTLTFVAQEGSSWSDSTNQQGAGAYADTIYEDVARDYLFSAASTKSIVLGNLDPGTTYTLDLISVRDSSSGTASTATITVNGNAATGSHDGKSYQAKTDGWVDGTVLRWDNLTPDNDGNITITFEPELGSYYANGFVLVPEPGSMGLLSLGALAVFARRRTTA